MTTFRSPLLFSLLAIAAGVPAQAQYLGAADCRLAQVEPAPSGAVRWDGPCKEGYADGKGTLQWTTADRGRHTLEALFVRGEASGEAKLTTLAGVYTGAVRRGVPHGQGYFEYANNAGWYEGAVVDGKREGAGIYLAPDRSKYTGYWKDGVRHGLGEETFALGGSYKGYWQGNVFHGRGTIVYAGSGRKVEGEFRDGRLAGVPAPEIDTLRYEMKDMAEVGSHLASKRARNLPVPPQATWEELTEPQKNRIRSQYLALEHGDDPPYPLKGVRELYEITQRLTEKHDGMHGRVAALVTIGIDGKPKQGGIYATTNPELAKIVLNTMMVQKYKPASCQGKPCEMGYAVDFDYAILH